MIINEDDYDCDPEDVRAEAFYSYADQKVDVFLPFFRVGLHKNS